MDQVPLTLITGGLGYIGGCLVEQLLSARHQVRVIDSAIFGAPSDLDSRVDLVSSDLRDERQLALALKGIDSVVHLAAIVGDPACALNPGEARSVNLGATNLLIEAAKAAGVRKLVFASTCSVYGAGSGALLSEVSPLNPVSVYASTKIGAEQAVLGASSVDFETIVLRFATIFGLAPRLRFDLVANLLTARASRGLPVTIHGGEQWRPFLHVRDVASAIVRVLNVEPGQVNGIYNVGSNQGNYRLSDLGNLIARVIPGSSVSIDPATTDLRTYRVSFDHYEHAFGVINPIALDDGIGELSQYLLDHPAIDIADPTFDNARFLARSPRFNAVTAQDC